MNQAVPTCAGQRRGFRPLAEPAALVVATTLAGTGDLAGRLLALLRDYGGALTLAEIRLSVPPGFDPSRARVLKTLGALETSGLVHRRDMVTAAGSEPVWWAPRVPFAMPWNQVSGREGLA